jgi:Bifunctional DNA primase/polymerase, N-terminal
MAAYRELAEIDDPANAEGVNSNLSAALEVAQAGIPVFPMRVSKVGNRWRKMPAIKGWRTKATTDPETIEAWARTDPTYVFAIELEAAGLVVIDCDRHRADADGCLAFKQLLEANGGIPPVPITMSSGGGWHVYFRQPAVPIGCPVNTRLPPGIDVKGAGGSIVVPGSQRPDGAKWRAQDGKPVLAQAYRNGRLAVIPEWLEKLARKVERAEPKHDQKSHRKASSDRERAYAGAALDRQCGDIAGLAANSDRNKKLNTAVFGLGRLVARGWIDDAKVASGLTDAAVRCGLLKEDGKGAARATIASGLAAGFEKPIQTSRTTSALPPRRPIPLPARRPTDHRATSRTRCCWRSSKGSCGCYMASDGRTRPSWRGSPACGSTSRCSTTQTRSAKRRASPSPRTRRSPPTRWAGSPSGRCATAAPST